MNRLRKTRGSRFLILSGSRFVIFILFLQNNNHHFTCENDLGCIIIEVGSWVAFGENGNTYLRLWLA